MKQRGLKGRVALVTGASQGIGLASARALAEDGAAVVITARNPEKLEQAREKLLAAVPGARIETCAGDATDEAHVKAALAKAHGLEGRLDIIVSVVGDPTFKPLLMRDYESVRQEFDLNFGTAFLLVRHGVPLLDRGGAIVCVSSAAATQTNFGLSIYASAKAALERFVKAAAFELGGAGIRINAVRPGATLPPEREETMAATGMPQAFAACTPMGRLGRPEEIASVVHFLASDASGWVTGQTFSADGGMDQVSGPNFMEGMFGEDAMARIRAGKEA